ncbi:CCDC132 [Blepharisma stoltei]|uniref:Exocyst complex component Sec8 n=1 Tax=Blepharisma stoltei TaxID=1481888 RepID=A0AAU9IUU7_9CILI|nr:unnamed protein product [Blepharisma stoltei]
MIYLKRLFNKSKPNQVEYVEASKPDIRVQENFDVKSLSKDKVKEILESQLSTQYTESEQNHNIISEEIRQVNTIREIDDRIKQLEFFLEIANHGLYLQVMNNYDKFVNGMENIQLISNLLSTSKLLSQKSRSDISSLQTSLLAKTLKLVYLSKKKSKLRGLIEELDHFGEICFSTSLSIKQAIKEGNLYKALELCNEASEKLKTVDVSKYEGLKSIQATSDKKRGKVYLKMKEGLRQLCQRFEMNLYENVLLAYTTTATFAEVNLAIHTEFMNSITRIIKQALEQALANEASALSVESMTNLLNSTNYLTALRLMLRDLTNLMYNHHLISRWHEENDQAYKNEVYPVTHLYIKDENRLNSVIEFYSAVKLDLLRNRKHIWEKMQQRLAKFINEGNQILSLKINEIGQALGWLNTFIQIGEDFSGTPSSELKKAIEKKCVDYFNFFHQKTWNNLSNLLEAEQWSRLPIPKDFDISQEIYKWINDSTTILKALCDHFDEYNFTFSSIARGNPFDIREDLNNEDEADKDYLFSKSEESQLSSPGLQLSENAPVLCIAALNFIKAIGSYLQLMAILTPISFEVFLALSQMVEYFSFSIYEMFSNEGSKGLLQAEVSWRGLQGEDLESSYDTFLFQKKYKNLSTSMVRIKDFLDSMNSEGKYNMSPLKKQITQTSAGLYNIAETIIAIESLKNILHATHIGENYMKKVIPESQMNYVFIFFDNTHKIIEELENFLAETQIPRLIKPDWLNGIVTGLKWDENKNESNAFIDRLLHIVEDTKGRLVAIGGGSIPVYLQNKILTKAVKYLYDYLIDVFSKVKKCNSAGREQMQIDLLAFQEGLKEFFPEAPNLDAQLEYITIWSQSPDNVVKWILSHTELSLRLHKLLFSTSPQVMSLNKQTRAQLLLSIETHYKETIE